MSVTNNERRGEVRQVKRVERKSDRDGEQREWTVQDRDRELAQHSSIIQGV